MKPSAHRVLVLGAGRVSRPILRYFLDAEDCVLVVGNLFEDETTAMVRDHPRGMALTVDVSDEQALDRLVEGSDLLISLVPFPLHLVVARCAVRHRAHLITTSYVSPAMRALDGAARDAGVTLLNEVGLDPGLDHMSAMRMIHHVETGGGRIVGFSSCAGVLPAPEAANSPWKYKFSWNPRGALLAGRNPARFLEDGQVLDVPGDDLVRCTRAYDFEGLGRLEMYPNRDALSYIETYGLHDVRSMIRGTLRYPGWSETVHALLERRMGYAEGERDMVVMRHVLRVRRPDNPDESRVSSLVAFGEPGGDSATARTVSLPAAVAGRLLLDGRIDRSGVCIPTWREIYEPILTELERMGIRFEERSA